MQKLLSTKNLYEKKIKYLKNLLWNCLRLGYVKLHILHILA